MINRNSSFLIVGLGLIGGSYARALHKKGYRVLAITKYQSSIDYAKNEGFIDEGSAIVDENLIKQADVIIFSLYPSLEVEWLRNYQHLFKPGTLLSDVAGVKGGIIDEIQSFLRADVEMIACHPMAGKEVYGVENSDDAIFREANFIVVPTEKNTREAIDDAYHLGEILGFNKVSQLTIKQHDEIIGFVSQLTHVIAVSLMTCNEDENLQNYTGDSFRDLTRIARINENMWSELFIDNKGPLIEQIDAFMNQMSCLRSMIENEDVDELKKVFIKSTKRRALFDKRK